MKATILAMAIGLASLAADRPDPRGVKKTYCSPEAGAQLVLCRIYHDGGLVLEFSRPVANAFFLFEGQGVVEVWLRRKDIGNENGVQIYEPANGATGIGISIDPGYVAVRLTGELIVIEDVVYAE